MNPYEEVEAELADRARAAFASGDGGEGVLFEKLGSVADYLRRVALPDASPHYRAEKSGALLDAAIRLHVRAQEAYARWPEDDDGVYRAALLRLEDVTEAVCTVMWATGRAARGEDRGVERRDAAEVQQAAQRLRAWATELAATAVPDEEDEG